MKKLIVLMFLMMATMPSQLVHAATCTPTGFFRDSINMTAALINPPGTVSGNVDATGCNIGIYYNTGTGQVSNANVFGANYFGVLVNGDVNMVSVDITSNQIHHIGETPLNGAQHGIAVYYRALGTGKTSGKIWNNTISVYQKGGIVVNGRGAKADVKGNTVTGQGPVNYIAQNGIQVGFGADATVQQNNVSGNSYTGPGGASSGGILVVGGPCYGLPDYTTGTQVTGNTLTNNDVGVFSSNLDAACNAPSTMTNVNIINNTITNNAVSNTSGNGSVGYQAGVSDVGNNDKIINNTISGVGYASCLPGYCVAIDADASFTNRPKVRANSVT